MTFERSRRLRTSRWLAAVVAGGVLSPMTVMSEPAIQLDLKPRICTLGPQDHQCETQVQATWQATRSESLCLIILERKNVKKCWENFDSGTYSLELTFSDDLTFELRDPQLHEVLASQVLRVIREAIRYRHRRREPWNIFD